MPKKNVKQENSEREELEDNEVEENEPEGNDDEGEIKTKKKIKSGKPQSFAKIFASGFQSVQRLRVAAELSIETRKKLGQEIPEKAIYIHNRLETLEQDYVDLLTEVAKSDPIWIWLQSLKGIAARLGAMIISQVDISIPHTRTSLWKFAGYGLVKACPLCLFPTEKIKIINPEGEEIESNLWNKTCQNPKCGHTILLDTEWTYIPDRARKGHKIRHNRTLKKTIYLCARLMIRWKTEPYKSIFDEALIKYSFRTDGAGKPWSESHIKNAARRKTAKIFLDHLWFVWRWSHNLPTRLPYELEYLKHKNIIPPPNFDPDIYFHKKDIPFIDRLDLLKVWCSPKIRAKKEQNKD